MKFGNENLQRKWLIMRTSGRGLGAHQHNPQKPQLLKRLRHHHDKIRPRKLGEAKGIVTKKI